MMFKKNREYEAMTTGSTAKSGSAQGSLLTKKPRKYKARALPRKKFGTGEKPRAKTGGNLRPDLPWMK